MSSEAFEQLCMSKTPTLPWLWVIEALDSSNDADLSRLIHLLKSVPYISEEMGKDAREVGALKILEGVASRYSLDNGSISDTSEIIEFDPSDSCERVLGRIIQEAQASNVKNGGRKIFKWDIQSFIASKRASLPIISLQKLKFSFRCNFPPLKKLIQWWKLAPEPEFQLQVTGGSHSVLESFKERSGLAVRTQCDENIPVNSGNINEPVHGLENRGKVNEAVGPITNSNYSSTEKYDVDSQENVPDRNLLPTKRSRSDIGQTYKKITTTDLCCGPGGEAAKKRKQAENVPSPSGVDVVITSPQHDIPVKPSEIFVENTETEGCSLDKEKEVEEREHVVCPDNLEDQEALLGGPGNPMDEDITRNLSSQLQIQNDKVGEGIRDDINLLPTKRSRSGIGQTYKDITTTDLCRGAGGEASKKRKKAENVSSLSGVDVVIISSQPDIPVKPSEIFVQNTETEGCSLDKEKEVEEREHVVCPDNLEDQEALLGGPGNPMDEDITRNLSSQMQVQNDKVGECLRDSEGYELRTSNGKSLAAVEAPNGVDKAINSCEHHNHASRAAEEKDHMEPDQDPETASGSDEYHEEMTDVNLMKNAFLSSQCTHSEDSLATQLDRCVKCNNGGQLLVCSSNTCPIVVHENCLGSTAIFDGEGQFYCPFCAYYQALSEYTEVKKRTSLARKNMATFVRQQVVSRPKGSERSSKSERHHLKRDDKNVPDNHKAFSSAITQINSSSKLEGGQNNKLSVPCAGDRSPCREKVVDLAHEAPSISENIDLGGKKTEQECHSPSRQANLHVDLQPLKIPDGDVSSDKENDNARQNRIRVHKKMRTECASPVEAPCGSNIESSEGESDKSAASNYTIRLRTAPKDHYYPAIPQRRRKKVPWTSEEEEKLKEGVEKFCKGDELAMPWKYILEFGAGVFQKGRTSGDLKDKWRNICKGSRRKK